MSSSPRAIRKGPPGERRVALAVPPLTSVVLDQMALAEHLAASIVASPAGRPTSPRPGSGVMSLVVRGSA